ncbi:hypothetical protein AXF42_Ash004089 [Apostasia shenzhenica]|uniref:Uncharacterized protein n=1 Tax=Apostasia shenzhenica TaxID=1088818 RepID=A0A2I0A1X5_9ASPA|nr:hypothetical protein AXF42_Ash004089 [Apostasia shenzhenica]
MGYSTTHHLLFLLLLLLGDGTLTPCMANDNWISVDTTIEVGKELLKALADIGIVLYENYMGSFLSTSRYWYLGPLHFEEGITAWHMFLSGGYVRLRVQAICYFNPRELSIRSMIDHFAI